MIIITDHFKGIFLCQNTSLWFINAKSNLMSVYELYDITEIINVINNNSFSLMFRQIFEYNDL